MTNKFFLDELKKRIGKPTKLSIVGEDTTKSLSRQVPHRAYFFVYGILLDVSDDTVVMQTKWNIKQIPLEQVREIQDVVLNYENGGSSHDRY